MYSIADYGAMIADRVRMDAFDRALRRAIRPGSVVADIGTGTGILALLACRAGARRVYAIEPDPAIAVARQIARANGFGDRIEFIEAASTAVTLPEKADVIVADIGGILPWFGRHIPSIVDARRRLLAPGGVLIPQQDTVWAAVVDAPDVYASHTGPWRENAYGLDMEPARELVVNTLEKRRVQPEQLLTRPVQWATVDYHRTENVNVRASVNCTAGRAGTAHGFVAGFDRVLLEGIELSNAPDAPEAVKPERIYGTLFFPFSSPFAVAAGDTVSIDIDGTLMGDDYVWSWTTHTPGPPNAPTPHRVLRQSTFFGTPVSAARLEKRSASYRPTLNEEGTITRFVLEAMRGDSPLEAIATETAARFSGRFANPGDALRYVADLAQQYAGGEGC